MCSGYGGIDLGLRRVLPNVRTIAYVEIEAFAVANLVEKMESPEEYLDAAPVWTNLKTFNAKPFRGMVDILSGGFPCQPFSCAGQRKGTEDPRHLFPDIERIIGECEPSIVFLENVEGIISAKYGGEDGTSVLKYVLERLEKLGYTATAGVFSAIECGAPHQRKRVFICGVSNARRNDETTRRQREALQEGSNEWDVKGGR
jgi:DNA (cytosine-5)-methyltransferase 1